jgi:hypothetical protein
MRAFMFVAIILALSTGRVSALMATPPDAVACNDGVHAHDAATSNETFNAWVNHYLTEDDTPLEKYSPTHATDAMNVDVTTNKYFRGHVGGGGGTFAKYDAKHRVLGYCQFYDTAEGLYLVGNIGPPPFAVTRGDLSGFSSRAGLRLGSTIADVRRVYGPASTVTANGKSELRYIRYIKVPNSRSSMIITTSFIFVNGRVTQIARTSGF